MKSNMLITITIIIITILLVIGEIINPTHVFVCVGMFFVACVVLIANGINQTDNYYFIFILRNFVKIDLVFIITSTITLIIKKIVRKT